MTESLDKFVLILENFCVIQIFISRKMRLALVEFIDFCKFFGYFAFDVVIKFDKENGLYEASLEQNVRQKNLNANILKTLCRSKEPFSIKIFF